MARMKRGNVVLRVEDYEVEHYRLLGYAVTDDSGVVLQNAIPNDIVSLKAAYTERGERIAELESIVAKLTAEISALKKKKTTTSKS